VGLPENTLQFFTFVLNPVKGWWMLIFICVVSRSQAQDGPAFAFVNVPSNARTAAMGGVNVSLADREHNAFFSNPALTGDTLNGFASASYQFYVADIGQSTFSWSPDIRGIGMLSFGVQHFCYGSITSTDAAGNNIGDFRVAETMIVISRQHQLGAFRLGASAKMLFSSMAGFRASAIAWDLGGVFVHPDQNLTVGLIIKNAGFILNDYTESSDSALPLDVQAGVTFQPEHMPLRFSFTVHRLMNNEALTYASDGARKTGLVDKMFRHFNFATEVLLHKNVNALLGYNFGRHQELKLGNGGGGAGVCFGFSARVRTAEFVFSRSTYVAGSPSYSLTISADLRRMIKKYERN
jgi:hypothetical protein